MRMIGLALAMAIAATGCCWEDDFWGHDDGPPPFDPHDDWGDAGPSSDEYLGEFTSISVCCDIEVRVEEGREHTIRVEGSSRTLDIEVDAGRLVLSRSGSRSGRLEVFVTAPRIDSIDASEDCALRVEALRGEEIEVLLAEDSSASIGEVHGEEVRIDVREDSRLRLGEVHARELELEVTEDSSLEADVAVELLETELTEDSHIELHGIASRLRAEIEEDSVFDAGRLQACTAELGAQEDSFAEIHVGGSASIRVEESSTVIIRGDAEIDAEVTEDSALRRERGDGDFAFCEGDSDWRDWGGEDDWDRDPRDDWGDEDPDGSGDDAPPPPFDPGDEPGEPGDEPGEPGDEPSEPGDEPGDGHSDPEDPEYCEVPEE